MKRFKFKIHPLFWILGIMLTFIGEGFLFLVYIFTALIHEYAHCITAAFYKCRTEEIVLYPYGAVLYGEFSCLKPSEEAIVAISGPCFNLFMAIIFTALWWVAPELYMYTDSVVAVNISIAFFNLLPVYPLDGGRILMAALSIKSGTKKAFQIVRTMGFICCFAFALLYFLSFLTQPNYTFAIICVFLFCSVTDDKHNGGNVQQVIYPPTQNILTRGVEIKNIQVSGELKLFELIRLLSTQYYYIIHIIDSKGKTTGIIKHEKLENMIIKYGGNILLKDIKA